MRFNQIMLFGGALISLALLSALWGYHSLGFGPSVLAGLVIFIVVVLLPTGRLQKLPNLVRQYA